MCIRDSVNTVTKESPDYKPINMLDEVVVKPTPESTIPIPPDTETRQDRTQTQAPPATEIITEENQEDETDRFYESTPQFDDEIEERLFCEVLGVFRFHKGF